MNPVNGVLTTEMKNTDIPISTKYPVHSGVTMSNPDRLIQNILPNNPPIDNKGIKSPPGNPVAFEMMVIVASVMIIIKLLVIPKLLFSIISMVNAWLPPAIVG